MCHDAADDVQDVASHGLRAAGYRGHGRRPLELRSISTVHMWIGRDAASEGSRRCRGWPPARCTTARSTTSEPTERSRGTMTSTEANWFSSSPEQDVDAQPVAI